MSPAIGFLAASFAMTAIGEVIKYQEAKKKEKRIREINERKQAAEEKRAAYMLNQKKDAAIKAKRIQSATAARTGGFRGMDLEAGSAAIERTGRESSLAGALSNLEAQYDMTMNEISLRTEGANVSCTPSLTSQLGIAATQASSSVLGTVGMDRVEKQGGLL